VLKLSAKVIEHFQSPRNVGVIENPEGIGVIENPICGDVTEIYLRIKDGVVKDAKFKSFGCAVTIASASVFTEKIKGKKILELVSGSDEEVVKKLLGLIECELGELPGAKLHCPPATVQAFLEAVMQHQEKQGESQIASRIKKLIPLVDKYYKRGREEKDKFD
jgi:nitrogen fixation NifU-like protein